mmetsp:Transcript_46615/g.129567  ORF Transcript_46615/g.129567 Transcript_46615/m.129567 type:complete len:502 (-) Transcript_46615:71-1576(-)
MTAPPVQQPTLVLRAQHSIEPQLVLRRPPQFVLDVRHAVPQLVHGPNGRLRARLAAVPLELGAAEQAVVAHDDLALGVRAARRLGRVERVVADGAAVGVVVDERVRHVLVHLGPSACRTLVLPPQQHRLDVRRRALVVGALAGGPPVGAVGGRVARRSARVGRHVVRAPLGSPLLEVSALKLVARILKREQPAAALSRATVGGACHVEDDLLLLLALQPPAIERRPRAHEHRRDERVAPRDGGRAAQPREEVPLGWPRQLAAARPRRRPEAVDGVVEVVEKPTWHHPEAVKVRRVRLLLHADEPPRAHRHRRRHAIEEGEVGPRADHPGVAEPVLALVADDALLALENPHVLQEARAVAVARPAAAQASEPAADRMVVQRRRVAAARRLQLRLDRVEQLDHLLQPRVFLADRGAGLAVVAHPGREGRAVPAEVQVQEEIDRHELRVEQVALDGRMHAVQQERARRADHASRDARRRDLLQAGQRAEVVRDRWNGLLGRVGG